MLRVARWCEPEALALLAFIAVIMTLAILRCGLLCYARYDQDGRLTWSIDTADVGRWDSGKACADLSEDNVDSLRVMYSDDGAVLALLRSRPPSLPDGGAVALMQPDGYDNAGWTGTATFPMPPRPHVAAPDGNVLAEGSQAIEALLHDTYGLSRRRLAYSGK